MSLENDATTEVWSDLSEIMQQRAKHHFQPSLKPGDQWPKLIMDVEALPWFMGLLMKPLPAQHVEMEFMISCISLLTASLLSTRHICWSAHPVTTRWRHSLLTAKCSVIHTIAWHGDYLGKGLANICYVANPEVVILGGGNIARGYPQNQKIRTAWSAALGTKSSWKTFIRIFVITKHSRALNTSKQNN